MRNNFSAYSKRTSPAGVSSTIGGTVEEAGLVGLLELANLRTDSGLRAEYLLARARETLKFGDKDKSSELVKVHNQNVRRDYSEFHLPDAELISFLS